MSKNLLLLLTILAAQGLSTSAAGGQELRLTLDETLRRASLESPRVLLAQTQQNSAAAAADLESRPFWPHLAVGTGAAWTYGFPLSIEGAAPSIFEVDYRQSIYDRRQSKQAAARRFEARASAEGLAAERRQAALQAGEAYLELRTQRRKLSCHQAMLASAEKVLDIIRTRVQAGYAEPRDITGAELQVAREKLALISGAETRANLEEELRTGLGLPAGTAIVTGEDEVTGPEGGESEAALIESALGADSTLKQLRFEERATRASLDGLRYHFLPKAQAVAKYSLFSRFNNFDQYFLRFQRNNILAGVSIQIPLYAPETAPETHRLKATLEGTRIKIEMRSNQIRQEIRRRLRGLNTLAAQEEVTRLQLALAQQDHLALQAQYEQGTVQLADLEGARQDENKRRIDYADARLAREKALLELRSLSGQLLPEAAP